MSVKPARMLTVRDVAERLAISAEQARRLIRRGDLPAVDIATPGRPNYRVAPAALDQYLRDRAVAS